MVQKTVENCLVFIVYYKTGLARFRILIRFLKKTEHITVASVFRSILLVHQPVFCGFENDQFLVL
jgi:hypothetical protein